MLEVPSIGCGGFVDDLGGVITMVNMSSPTSAKLYDCIWLVRPLMSFQTKSHLLVRLVQFSNTGTAAINANFLLTTFNLIDCSLYV